MLIMKVLYECTVIYRYCNVVIMSNYKTGLLLEQLGIRKTVVRVGSAYGRKYNSFEDAKKDYDSGKDFYSYTDRAYCSIRDFDKELDTVVIELEDANGPCPGALQIRGYYLNK